MRVPNTTSSQWNLSLHWEFCWHSHQLARIVLLVLQIANLGSCNSFSTLWPAQVVVALSAAGGLSLQAVCGSCAYWSWMVIICFVCQTALESQLLFFLFSFVWLRSVCHGNVATGPYPWVAGSPANTVECARQMERDGVFLCFDVH